MNKLNKLLRMEKKLLSNYENKSNQIIISEASFDDNGFTIEGYNHLKEEIEYIEIDCDFDITIPKGKEDIFNQNLTNYITKDLYNTNKRKEELNRVAALFFLLGIFFLALYYSIFKKYIFSDFLIIISWVFVWTTIEKIFFEKPILTKKRIKLLMLLDYIKK